MKSEIKALHHNITWSLVLKPNYINYEGQGWMALLRGEKQG